MEGLRSDQRVSDPGDEVKLTGRELDVLKLVAEGMNPAEIAVRLNIAKNTVITHQRNMMDKLNFNRATQLVAYAYKKGHVKIG